MQATKIDPIILFELFGTLLKDPVLKISFEFN